MVVAVCMPPAGAIAAALVAGIIDCAGQLILEGVGVLDSFSWEDVIGCMASAGFGFGAAQAAMAGEKIAVTITSITEAALEYGAVNFAEQLGELALGQRSKLDFSELMAVIVSSAIGQAFGGFKLSQEVIEQQIEKFTLNLINAGFYSAFAGTDFSYENVAASYIGSAIGQALGSEFTKFEGKQLQQNHIQTAHVTSDKQYNQAQMHANGVNTDPALNNTTSQVPNSPTPELNKPQNPAPNPQQPLAIRTDYYNAHPNQNYFPSDDVPPANEAPRPAPPSANVQKPKVIVPKAQPTKAANDPIIPKKITTAASTIAHDAAKMLKNEWQSLRDDVATTANDVEKVALPVVAKAMPYIADGIVYVKNELDSVVDPIRKIASGANNAVNSSLSNLGHMTEHIATDAYQGAKLTFTDPTQALNNFKNNAAGFRQDINHVGGEVAQSINHLGGEISQGAAMTWNHPAQALQNVSANVARGVHDFAANIGHDVDYLEHASAYQYGEMLGNGLVLAAGALATDGLGEFAAGGDMAAGAAARAGLGARLGDEAGAGVKFGSGLDATGAGLDSTGAGLDLSSDAASEMATRAGLNSSNASVFAKAAVESDEPASAAGAAIRNGVFGGRSEEYSQFETGMHHINPQEIRFTQPNVGTHFTNGSRVDELTPKLKSGEVLANDLPAIKVVQKNGKLFSIDNRRLVAFNAAGLDKIPVEIVSADDPDVALRLKRRFDPILGEGHYVVVVSKAGRADALAQLEDFGMIKGVSNGY